jgi:hypothetical protein
MSIINSLTSNAITSLFPEDGRLPCREIEEFWRLDRWAAFLSH